MWSNHNLKYCGLMIKTVDQDNLLKNYFFKIKLKFKQKNIYIEHPEARSSTYGFGVLISAGSTALI